ncbi:MAG TPA: histidine phosphatase family protein [Firmicutes bacterium]|jgi:broad specificity phosphatase PhoE|nr:histidine phosphatase family protein [Bacillota bacterium]
MFICTKQKNSGRTGRSNTLPQQTVFCLVRHGSTDWNVEGRIQGWTDTRLNADGRREVEEAARRLQGRGWEGIVASDLKRARETAEIIGHELGLEVLFFPKLRERSFGPLEGMNQAQVEVAYPGSRPERELPGLESKAELRSRAEQAFSFLARIFEGRRMIVVTHGGLLKAFFAQSLQTEERTVANAETVEVVFADGNWRFN